MEIWKNGKLENKNLEKFIFGKWVVAKMEIWKNVNLEKCKFGMMEIWNDGNLERWKFGKMEI